MKSIDSRSGKSVAFIEVKARIELEQLIEEMADEAEIVEQAQGVGSFHEVQKVFMIELCDIADRHGIRSIADKVQHKALQKEAKSADLAGSTET